MFILNSAFQILTEIYILTINDAFMNHALENGRNRHADCKIVHLNAMPRG